MTVLAVLAAGALGAVARFVVDDAVKRRWNPLFPWGTLLINVSGSVLLGIVAGMVMFHTAPDTLKSIVGTGFCGGYTTFSTASVEIARLIEKRAATAAVLYAAASVALGVTACAGGLVLAWAI